MKTNITALLTRYSAIGGNNLMGFCKREGISYSWFRYHWKRAQAGRTVAARSGFVKLQVRETPPCVGIPCDTVPTGTMLARVFCRGQVSLEVQGSFSVDFLRGLAGC